MVKIYAVCRNDIYQVTAVKSDTRVHIKCLIKTDNNHSSVNPPRLTVSQTALCNQTIVSVSTIVSAASNHAISHSKTV